MSNRERAVSNLLGVIGGVVGGYVGYWLFVWITRQGFYALVVPGALLGLGCGLLARHPSTLRGVVCGAAAVALALFTEWSMFPFNADPSVSYFLAHVGSLKPVTLLMIGLGGVAAYWLGKDAGYGGPARGWKPGGPREV
jgi:membrane protein YqaA with SNARE-associated domain